MVAQGGGREHHDPQNLVSVEYTTRMRKSKGLSRRTDYGKPFQYRCETVQLIINKITIFKL